MKNKKYIEEIINEESDFHEYYAWDRETMKEIIKNLLEDDDEEFLEELADKIDEGEEVTIETAYISKFRIATPEELEKATEDDKARLEDALAKDIDYDKIFDNIQKIYEKQFEDEND